MLENKLLEIIKDNDDAQFFLLMKSYQNFKAQLKENKITLDTNTNLFNYITPNGSTIFIEAIRRGNYKIVESLINAGADVNQRDKSDQPPLTHAARLNLYMITDLLLQKGAVIDAKVTPYGETALFIACDNDSFETVQCLLQHGANINSTRTDGGTSLYTATQENHIRIVELLVNSGANTQIAYKGFSPLHAAVSLGHKKSLAALLKAKDLKIDYVNINNNKTAMDLAALKKREDIQILLIEADANTQENLTRTGEAKTWEALLSLGVGICANIRAVPENVDLSNKIVFGLMLNGKAVSRKTKGFENAITNIKEFIITYNKGVSFPLDVIKAHCKQLANKNPQNRDIKNLNTVLDLMIRPQNNNAQDIDPLLFDTEFEKSPANEKEESRYLCYWEASSPSPSCTFFSSPSIKEQVTADSDKNHVNDFVTAANNMN